MDPPDTGQAASEIKNPATENGTPSETLSPTKRQCKKNPKYTDYETDDSLFTDIFQERACETRPQVESATPAKTPKRRRRPPSATRPPTVGRTQARGGRPSKKTPARKTPAHDRPVGGDGTPTRDGVQAGDGVHAGNGIQSGDGVQAADGATAGNGIQQENETPKPKRKYVRRKPLQRDAVNEPPPDKQAPEPEEEIEPGGRRRRGAARAALKYLRALASDVFNHAGDEADCQPGDHDDHAHSQKTDPSGHQAQKGRKRKRLDCDAADSLDFVPEDQELNFNEEEEEDLDLESDFSTHKRSSAAFHSKQTSYNVPTNGLSEAILRPVWDSAETTRKYREQNHSSWVFPDWIPSSADWSPVPPSVLEYYLPQQLQSAAFRVSRDGLQTEESPLQCLHRFEALPPHPLRWDFALFVGGPVWALEWCPAPDGAPATQYLALACHRGMEDRHRLDRTHAGPGLVQLWDLGRLEYKKKPDRRPALSYALALDDGFIWSLKWCPAGCWEPPGAARKPPFLSRLGLLAVVSSSSVVSLFSLPHPDVLLQNRPTSGKDGPAVFKARPVVRLKLGSLKAPRLQRSGMALSVDWLPQKPHNVIAVGFYDGIVGLWDLNTKSALLRVRESTESISLLPYRCFPAHHNAVRAMSFCPASRFLLVTAGDDHCVKAWDLSRLWDPLMVHRRQMANDLFWMLKSHGVLMVQESAFSPKLSLGLNFTDYSFHSILLIPRTSNVWSFSYSEWLHSVVTADLLGDLILALLPQLSYTQQSMKRSLDRRFPVCLTSLVPHQTSEGEREEEEEEEEPDGKERPSSGGGNQENPENLEPQETRGPSPTLHLQTYREAVKKYFLHHEDNNMVTFAGSAKRPLWRRMCNTETKSKVNLDELPLAAVYKVRFNPNMSSHPWLASGGQSGVVRLNCLRCLTSSHMEKLIRKNQEAFRALHSPQDRDRDQDLDRDQDRDRNLDLDRDGDRDQHQDLDRDLDRDRVQGEQEN